MYRKYNITDLRFIIAVILLDPALSPEMGFMTA